MGERLPYWKCRDCQGTGKEIRYWTTPPSTTKCARCDGTGNALVDGEKRAYEREIERIEKLER